MIHSLLGLTLQKLFLFCDGFDSITIINIFIELLDCLSHIHFNKILHNDIKPNNLAWNCFSNKLSKSKISIIDFNSSINLGIKTVKNIHGNSYYGSIASNQGKIPEAKDEIESVIYSLIKLNKKILSWMENETIQR